MLADSCLRRHNHCAQAWGLRHAYTRSSVCTREVAIRTAITTNASLTKGSGQADVCSLLLVKYERGWHLRVPHVSNVIQDLLLAPLECAHKLRPHCRVGQNLILPQSVRGVFVGDEQDALSFVVACMTRYTSLINIIKNALESALDSVFPRCCATDYCFVLGIVLQ